MDGDSGSFYTVWVDGLVIKKPALSGLFELLFF